MRTSALRPQLIFEIFTGCDYLKLDCKKITKVSDEMKRSDSIAPTVNADSAKFLGLIPASFDTEKSEWRQKKPC
jgi:hypothetical protein